jgi:precorrin-2/cobalt-factor-2 C20-methyltransferase
MKHGKVVCVGVGPGDPELLTVKAIRTLNEADVVFAPTWHLARDSLALGVVRPILKDRQTPPQVRSLVFPMVKDKKQLRSAWKENTDIVAKEAQDGKLVAFVVIGDPNLYSTFTYVQRELRIRYPSIKIETIPGIASLSACAAKSGIPLAFGKESLLIMSEFDEELVRGTSRLVDNIACLKCVKKLPEILKTLKESNSFNDESQVTIAKRCSFTDEDIWEGELGDALQLNLPEDYLATMIVRRRANGA